MKMRAVLVALFLGSVPTEAQRPNHHPDRVTSITQLITVAEWRSHGTENLSIGSAGLDVVNVGQAGDVPLGSAPGYALWEVKVSGVLTGTGWPERFYFSEPIPKPTEPRPLLVFNHRFGKTNTDLLTSTDFAAQAAARGWYVVAPLAASNKNFASGTAQQNTSFVLDWVTNTPGNLIDMNRIYGVGFSMGGGLVMSYAARHVDPTRPMLAAVVNHTGDVCLNHVYANESSGPNGGQFVLDFWFGEWHGSRAGMPPFGVAPPPHNIIPEPAPVTLQRYSVIDYDQQLDQFLTGGDMVRNMLHVPLKMLRASDDLIDYLEVQNDQLDQHLQTKYGFVNGSPTYQYDVLPFNGHEWSLLDEGLALDFLEQHSLQLPMSGQVLADRNARWFYFTTDLADSETNAAFAFDINTTTNTLTLTDVTGLGSLTIDTLLAGLDPQAALTLDFTPTGSAGPVIFFLRDYFEAPPSQVLRDGVPTNAWQLVEDLLVLLPPNAAAHTWEIIP